MITELTDDTKVTLLLCGHWEKSTDTARPLGLAEYNRLASWLKENNLRLSALLDDSALDILDSTNGTGIEVERIKSLVSRGGGMAFEAEYWLNHGFWIISRSDDIYPQKLKKVLRKDAPALLYGIGELDILDKPGIAIVGSRDVDNEGAQFSEDLGGACARDGCNVISGGARGVDMISMAGALNEGGYAVGILANDLAKIALYSGNRIAISEGRLVLMSPFHPKAGFNQGSAMARNKLIYALADAAVIVSAADGSGGTWAGAVENLTKWKVPMFVNDISFPPGNRKLIKQGGTAFPAEALINPSILIEQTMQVNLPVEGPFDTYDIALPHLLRFLIEPKGKKEIAEFLSVPIKQMNLWLKKALGGGKIEKLSKPVRYMAVLSGDTDKLSANGKGEYRQATMFD